MHGHLTYPAFRGIIKVEETALTRFSAIALVGIEGQGYYPVVA
jgi:hypothetical protein